MYIYTIKKLQNSDTYLQDLGFFRLKWLGRPVDTRHRINDFRSDF